MAYGDLGAEVAHGQWWRILTSMWLHLHPMHLVSNMLALAVVGRSIERMLGWRGFVLMYLLSGMGAALATDIARPYVLSIGASGAVFGVFGCLVGFTLRYPGQFPSQGLRSLMWAVLVFVGYNAAFGTGPGVNWIAHVGGYISGGLCGAVLTAPLEPHALPGRRQRDARLALAGAVVVTAALLAMAGRIPNVRIAIDELWARDARLTDSAVAAASTGAPTAVVSAIDRQILPDLADARHRIKSLDRVPPAHRKLLRAFDGYLQVRERAWTTLAEGLAATDFDAMETAHWLHKRADDGRDQLRETLQVKKARPAAPAIAPAVDDLLEGLVAD
jgi:rhomboid protease GluP